MNSSGSEHHAGVALRFGISVGVVSLVIVLIVASYLCNYKRLQLQQPPPQRPYHYYSDDDDEDDGDVEHGPAGTIDFTRIRFSEVANLGDCNCNCCSICLGEYKDEDWVRQLPDCQHIFHVDCIARWFGLHGTCPLCRNSAAVLPQRFNNFFVPFAR